MIFCITVSAGKLASGPVILDFRDSSKELFGVFDVKRYEEIK